MAAVSRAQPTPRPRQGGRPPFRALQNRAVSTRDEEADDLVACHRDNRFFDRVCKPLRPHLDVDRRFSGDTVAFLGDGCEQFPESRASSMRACRISNGAVAASSALRDAGSCAPRRQVSRRQKWPGAGCGHRTPAEADNPGKKLLPAPPPTVSSRALECKAGAAPRPQRPLVAPEPPNRGDATREAFLARPSQGSYKEHREPRDSFRAGAF
jgi:hypothetical protein